MVVRDVSARRRAEDERERLLARAALLAEASTLFDQSLDEARTLDSVARLCVRDLADRCVVVLGSSTGPPRRAATAARDPQRAVDAGAVAAEAAEVRRTGGSAIVDDAGEVRAIVPLSARGRVVGALAASFDDLPAPDRPETVTLLEDLARRAALALDNARLYEERTSIAQALQRSLLPPAPPADPGRRARGALPARRARGSRSAATSTTLRGRRRRVGARGRRRLRQGPRGGRGDRARPLHAARRRAARPPPRAVLARSSTTRCCASARDFASAPCSTRRWTRKEDGIEALLATGGHPLPLCCAPTGRVETAGRPGTLLGIVGRAGDLRDAGAGCGRATRWCSTRTASVEASPADEALATDRLAALLAGEAGRDAGEIAAAIEHKALEVQDGRLRDDVAVVVLRVRPGGRERVV